VEPQPRSANTDQPDDTDWDWSQTYSAQVVQSYSSLFGFVDHLKVRRHDGQDVIAWDVLQRIKDDLLGSDMLAVEFYPPQEEVVNDVNRRHLWAGHLGLVEYYREISLRRREQDR